MENGHSSVVLMHISSRHKRCCVEGAAGVTYAKSVFCISGKKKNSLSMLRTCCSTSNICILCHTADTSQCSLQCQGRTPLCCGYQNVEQRGSDREISKISYVTSSSFKIYEDQYLQVLVSRVLYP